MENLKIVFDILEDEAKIPVGCNKSSSHLVLDACMTLEFKARWVADKHRNPKPEWHAFSGVVSRKMCLIALTHAFLNDLIIFTCDIQNAYLQEPSSEKHYVVCGLDFGLENAGKHEIIVRVLHGGKNSGADHWLHDHSDTWEM